MKLRSQDKEIVTPYTGISYECRVADTVHGIRTLNGLYISLGKYESKERCIEVISEIIGYEDELQKHPLDISNTFEMPKE